MRKAAQYWPKNAAATIIIADFPVKHWNLKKCSKEPLNPTKIIISIPHGGGVAIGAHMLGVS